MAEADSTRALHEVESTSLAIRPVLRRGQLFRAGYSTTRVQSVGGSNILPTAVWIEQQQADLDACLVLVQSAVATALEASKPGSSDDGPNQTWQKLGKLANNQMGKSRQTCLQQLYQHAKRANVSAAEVELTTRDAATMPGVLMCQQACLGCWPLP